VQFIFFPFKPLEETLHADVTGLLIAGHDDFLLRRAQIAEGNIERNSGGARIALQFLPRTAVAGLGPRLDRAFVDRFAAIGNYQIGIEIDGVAKSLAARAGAVGIVEGE
jgi:hypothetical protein